MEQEITILLKLDMIYKKMRQPWLLMTYLICVQCLTQTELSQFGTSGDFPEAYVTVDSTPTV
jgi:hypothetical protein